MGHAGSKTKSLDQMLENPCLHSRGHIPSLILMKLGENRWRNDISDVLYVGHVGSKTR